MRNSQTPVPAFSAGQLDDFRQFEAAHQSHLATHLDGGDAGHAAHDPRGSELPTARLKFVIEWYDELRKAATA